MSNEQLFAQVNNTKKILFYEGLTTDTVSVNVDYNKREISADVVMQGILGHDTDKAFPGSEGKQLQSKLDEEIKRSIQADEAIEVVNKQLLHHYDWLNAYIRTVEKSIPTKLSQLEKDIYIPSEELILQISDTASEALNNTHKNSSNILKLDDSIQANSNAIEELSYVVENNNDILTAAVDALTSDVAAKVDQDTFEDELSKYATTQYVEEAVEGVEQNLQDYATKEYVDNEVANVKISLDYLTELLNGLDFIDGGDSSSINTD